MRAPTCGCATCGCAKTPCGCCDGVRQLTPADEANRPGLGTLRYRVGTHAQFLQTMKARLTTMEVQGVGSDGQTAATFRPLQGLTMRDGSDPSIALLDAWAVVGDVLSFYQERIANESYLRTATERRSVLELARLVGYALRPGVAASTFLAYTIDDKQTAPVTIAAGAAAQSVPDPDQQPQTFETSEELLASPQWNNLQVRMKQPQDITLQNALTIAGLQVIGTATNLKAGDKLLLLFSADGTSAVLRTVAAIDTQLIEQRTRVSLRPVPPAVAVCAPLLADAVQSLALLIGSGSSGAARRSLARSREILNEVYLDMVSLPPPPSWAQEIDDAADGTLPAPVTTVISALADRISDALKNLGVGTATPVTDPAEFVQKLLVPPVPQVRNSLALARSLRQAFSPTGAPLAAREREVGQRAPGGAPRTAAPFVRTYADVGTQLLVSFVPHLAPGYYAAWAGAQLNPTEASLKAVHVLRARASLFGATAPRLPTYTTGNEGDGTPAGILNPQNLWTDWTLEDDEKAQNAFLDQANEAIATDSYAIAEVERERQVLRVAQASTTARSAYGLSGQATELRFQLPAGGGWRDVGTTTLISKLRKTKLYVQSEPLELAAEPLTEPIASQQIPLDGLYKELVSGRWVILCGERADIEAVKGVTVAELQMISGLSHGFDPALPGDTIHTTLVLSTPLAYQYKRDTLRIYGNVVKATQGGARHETLGSGDGAQSLQSFTLKQPPLTFVAAPTPEGAQSTLRVYVDDVEWHESASLAWLDGRSRGSHLRRRRARCAPPERRGEREGRLSLRDRSRGQREGRTDHDLAGAAPGGEGGGQPPARLGRGRQGESRPRAGKRAAVGDAARPPGIGARLRGLDAALRGHREGSSRAHQRWWPGARVPHHRGHGRRADRHRLRPVPEPPGRAAAVGRPGPAAAGRPARAQGAGAERAHQAAAGLPVGPGGRSGARQSARRVRLRPACPGPGGAAQRGHQLRAGRARRRLGRRGCVRRRAAACASDGHRAGRHRAPGARAAVPGRHPGGGGHHHRRRHGP
jgi:hypothetical protein